MQEFFLATKILLIKMVANKESVFILYVKNA